MKFEVQTKRGGDWVIEAFHDRKDDAIYDAQKLLAGQFITAVRVVEEIHDSANDSYRTKVVFKRESSSSKGEGGPKTPNRAKPSSSKEAGDGDTADADKKSKSRRRPPPPAKKADAATKIVRGLFAFMFLVALSATIWLNNQPSDSEVLAEKAAAEKKKKKLAARNSAPGNAGGLTSGLSPDGRPALDEEELSKRSKAVAFDGISSSGTQDGGDEYGDSGADGGADSAQAFGGAGDGDSAQAFGGAGGGDSAQAFGGAGGGDSAQAFGGAGGGDSAQAFGGESGFFSDGDGDRAAGAGGYNGTGSQTAMLPPDPSLAYGLDTFRLRQARNKKVFLDITLKITFELENKKAGDKMALRAAALHDALYLELSRIVTRYQVGRISYYQSPVVTDQLMAVARKELGPGIVKRMVVTGTRRR